MAGKGKEGAKSPNFNSKSQVKNLELRALDQKRSRVAIIIPAYNEEARISEVLKVAKNVSIVDEIIVVNDGSTDRTAEVAKKYNVRLLNSSVNKGKGAALKWGIDSTDADILVFLDADLVGLTERHIENMVKPLLCDEELSMTVGKFERGRRRTDWAQKIAPSVSGQRAFRRSFMRGMPDFSNTGYGVEIAFNRYAKDTGAKVKEVLIDKATHVMKEEKLGIFKGVAARVKMYIDILRHLLSFSAE